MDSIGTKKVSLARLGVSDPVPQEENIVSHQCTNTSRSPVKIYYVAFLAKDWRNLITLRLSY